MNGRRLIKSVGVLISTCCVLLCLPITAFSCDEDTKVGYWWYCEPPTEDLQEEEERELLAPPPPAEEMMKMHPDDLQAMQESYLKQAVWTGAPEQTLDYYRVLDVVRKKALAFTAVTELVLLKNPELYAYGQYQKTGLGRKAATKARMRQVNQQLSNHRDKFGLFMFSRVDCIFCQSQAAVLKMFSERHGWPIKSVDITKHPQIASQFNINYVPVTVLVKKGTDKWMPIAVGEEALITIEFNAYRAIRHLNGDTTPGQFLQMSYQDGTGLDPDYVMEPSQ